MKHSFAVSSHYLYVDKTKPKLLASLQKNGFDDVIFFVADPNVDDYKFISKDTVLINHNSFDTNALVSIYEMNLKRDNWFLLHDTCLVGDNFGRFLSSYDHSGKNAIRLSEHWGICMNIGYMTNDYINNEIDISEWKNHNGFDVESSNKFKNSLVIREGQIFKNSKHFYCPHGNWTISTPDNTMYGGSTRVTEYHFPIDLYKYKANWSTKTKWTMDI